MPKQVIVIGAGPGGLATALLLAQSGVDVRVVERQSHVGGRSSTIKAPGGFQFDLGPTFFLYPRVLEEIFETVGRTLSDELPMRRLDPHYRLTFEAGGKIDATSDIPALRRNVAALAPRDAEQIDRFMAVNRRKLEAFKPILQAPFSSMRDVLTLAIMKNLRLVRPWSSLDGDLRRFFSDERVRLAFSFQSKYLGMSPFRCPSLFSILSFLEYEYGVWHPIGGCGSICTAMARILGEMGVEISLNEPVEEIVISRQRVTGVRTNRKRYSCDAVVINADFARAMKTMLPDHTRRRWNDRRLDKKKFGCSTFMLYLGVDKTFDDLPHHHIFLAKDYQKNLQEIERSHEVSSNPSLYVQNACVTDDTLAPRGKSTLYVLLPVSHQHPNIDWATEAPKFRDVALRKLEQMGYGDVRPHIQYEKMITPADWDQSHNIHLGATFNLAHTFDQMLHRRPNNRFEDVGGVYLVGGGTHPGSGLPVIFEGAKISAQLLLNDLGVRAAKPEMEQPIPIKAMIG
jgi:phytoene desaturase